MKNFKNSENWKNIVLVVVTLTALLVIGYSTFAQPLATKLPTRTNSNGIVWDIGFTKAVKSSVSGKAQEISPVNFTRTTATFGVYLNEPGDKISYEFTIKNCGELAAKVDSIYIVPTNQAMDPIFFTTSGLSVGDALNKGQEAKLTVTATFNPHYTKQNVSTTKSIAVIVNYVQNSQ